MSESAAQPGVVLAVAVRCCSSRAARRPGARGRDGAAGRRRVDRPRPRPDELRVPRRAAHVRCCGAVEPARAALPRVLRRPPRRRDLVEFLPTMRLVQILDPQFEQAYYNSELHPRSPGQDGRGARHRRARASRTTRRAGCCSPTTRSCCMIQDKKANLPEMLKLAEQGVQPDIRVGQHRRPVRGLRHLPQRSSTSRATRRWSMRSSQAQDALRQQGAGCGVERRRAAVRRRELAVLNPDYYYRSVLDIDLAGARREGHRHAAHRLGQHAPAARQRRDPRRDQGVGRRPARAGFKVCLVSNNWHDRVVARRRGTRVRTGRQGGQAAAVRVLVALKRMGSTRAQRGHRGRPDVHRRARRQADGNHNSAHRAPLFCRFTSYALPAQDRARAAGRPHPAAVDLTAGHRGFRRDSHAWFASPARRSSPASSAGRSSTRCRRPCTTPSTRSSVWTGCTSRCPSPMRSGCAGSSRRSGSLPFVGFNVTMPYKAARARAVRRGRDGGEHGRGGQHRALRRRAARRLQHRRSRTARVALSTTPASRPKASASCCSAPGERPAPRSSRSSSARAASVDVVSRDLDTCRGDRRARCAAPEGDRGRRADLRRRRARPCARPI